MCFFFLSFVVRLLFDLDHRCWFGSWSDIDQSEFSRQNIAQNFRCTCKDLKSLNFCRFRKNGFFFTIWHFTKFWIFKPKRTINYLCLFQRTLYFRWNLRLHFNFANERMVKHNRCQLTDNFTLNCSKYGCCISYNDSFERNSYICVFWMLCETQTSYIFVIHLVIDSKCNKCHWFQVNEMHP